MSPTQWQLLSGAIAALAALTVVGKSAWNVAKFFIELADSVRRLTASVEKLLEQQEEQAVEREDIRGRLRALEEFRERTEFAA